MSVFAVRICCQINLLPKYKRSKEAKLVFRAFWISELWLELVDLYGFYHPRLISFQTLAPYLI